MQTTVLKIGSRGSPLALAQAHEARARLMAAHNLPEEAFSIEAITTTGDRIQDRPLAEAGGKGLFTKEIEEALLAGSIDLAVHSSKDVPTFLPDATWLSAFLPREDPRDAFIGTSAKSIMDLPQGVTIGTSSLRGRSGAGASESRPMTLRPRDFSSRSASPRLRTSISGTRSSAPEAALAITPVSRGA